MAASSWASGSLFSSPVATDTVKAPPPPAVPEAASMNAHLLGPAARSSGCRFLDFLPIPVGRSVHFLPFVHPRALWNRPAPSSSVSDENERSLRPALGLLLPSCVWISMFLGLWHGTLFPCWWTLSRTPARPCLALFRRTPTRRGFMMHHAWIATYLDSWILGPQRLCPSVQSGRSILGNWP